MSKQRQQRRNNRGRHSQSPPAMSSDLRRRRDRHVTNGSKAWPNIGQNDPHALIPISAKISRPSDREREDALRFALGTSQSVSPSAQQFPNSHRATTAGPLPGRKKTIESASVFGNKTGSNSRPLKALLARRKSAAIPKLKNNLTHLPSFQSKVRRKSSVGINFHSSSTVVADVSRALRQLQKEGKSVDSDEKLVVKKKTTRSNAGAGISNGQQQTTLHGEDGDGQWLPATTADGQHYLWNPVTRKTKSQKSSDTSRRQAASSEQHLVHPPIPSGKSKNDSYSLENKTAQKLQSAWRGFQARKSFLNTRRTVEDFFETIIGERRPRTLHEQEQHAKFKAQQRRIRRQKSRAAIVLQCATRSLVSRRRALNRHNHKLLQQLHALWKKHDSETSRFADWPLQAAVFAHDYVFIRALLAVKADPDGRTRTGISRLHPNATLRSISTPINGESVRHDVAEHHIISKNNEQHKVVTPLTVAAQAGDIASISLLLQAGANLMTVSIKCDPNSQIVPVPKIPIDHRITNNASDNSDGPGRLQNRSIGQKERDRDKKGKEVDKLRDGITPRKPAWPVEIVLWQNHRALIPDVLLNSYFARYADTNVSSHATISNQAIQDSSMTSVAESSQASAEEAKIDNSSTLESKIDRSMVSSTSHCPPMQIANGHVNVAASASKLNQDARSRLGLVERVAQNIIFPKIPTSRKYDHAAAQASKLLNLKSIVDNQQQRPFWLDWSAAAHVSRLYRYLKPEKIFDNASSNGRTRSKILLPLHGRKKVRKRKHSRSISRSQREALLESTERALQPPSFLSRRVAQGLTSFLMGKTLFKNVNQPLTFDPMRGISALAAIKSHESRQSASSIGEAESRIGTKTVSNFSGVVQVNQRDNHHKIRTFTWTARVKLTPRAAETSKRRAAKMKANVAKLHGEPTGKAAPPKTIESVWGRIITQSTVATQKWSQRYRKEPPLFEKFTRSVRDTVHSYLKEQQRRRRLQRSRTARANVEGLLGNIGNENSDSLGSNKSNRLGLQLDNLFGDANARLRNKAKLRELKNGSRAVRGAQLPKRQVAGCAARQMQMLFRRRKAHHMFSHLKHLRSSLGDIPAVRLKIPKLHNSLPDNKHAHNRGGNFELRATTTNHSEVQGAAEVELSDDQQYQRHQQEFLMHKCISGDVVHVCEELSLYSLQVGTAQVQEAASSDSNEDIDHFAYINTQLLHQIFAIAAQLGYLEIIKLLVGVLQLNPYQNLDSSTGASAIHFASENGHAHVVSYLLSAVNSSDSCKKASPELKFDAKQHTRPLRSNTTIIHDNLTQDVYGGYTALHLAVQGSHVETVRILLNSKIDPDTPAYLPVRSHVRGDFELVTASDRRTNTGLYLLIVSPLAIVCSNIVARQSTLQRRSTSRIFTMLMKAGASVNPCVIPTQILEVNRLAAVAAAAATDDPSLSAGSSMSIHSVGSNGSTMSQGNLSVQSMMSQGVDSDVGDQGASSKATTRAAGRSNQKYKRKTSFGRKRSNRKMVPPPPPPSKTSAVSVINSPALFYAVKNANVKFVEVLLENGADADKEVDFLEHPAMFGARCAGNEPGTTISAARQLCRLPILHFAALSFNPNASSYTATAVCKEDGFQTISQQVIAVVDLILSYSKYGGQSSIDEGMHDALSDSRQGAPPTDDPISSQTNMTDTFTKPITTSTMSQKTLAVGRLASRRVDTTPLSLLDIALGQGNFELCRFLCAVPQSMYPTIRSSQLCADVHGKRLFDVRLPDPEILFVATEDHDIDTFVKAVSHGTRPHSVSKSGITPLISACSFVCEDIITYILDLEPGTYQGEPIWRSLAHQAFDGTTALILAAYRGFTSAVNKLMSYAYNHGVQLNFDFSLLKSMMSARMPDGSDALLAAAQQNHVAVVEALLANGMNPNSVKPKDGIGALYVAAGAGNTEIVRILLDPPNLRFQHLRSDDPQNIADGQPLCEDRPATFDQAGLPGDVNLLTKRGSSALHVAVQRSHVATVETLLAAGANLNIQSVSGSTPLALAVFHCDPRLVELLLSQPSIKVDNRHAQGNTEAMMAAFCGDVDILTMLVDAGASATATNENGASVETILKSNHNLTLKEARKKALELRAASGSSGDSAYSDFKDAATEAFGMCDTSGDGLISVDELAVFLRLVIDPEKMRGEQFRSFVRNEFNRLDHDGGGDIDFAEFRGCFGRYYRPYKALHFGDFAKEAYLVCIREKLKADESASSDWVESELERLKNTDSDLKDQHIDKKAFAAFINLVADRAVLNSGNAHSMGRKFGQYQQARSRRDRRHHNTGDKYSSLQKDNLMDGSNPKFEALVEREFNILDQDKGGTIDVSEFHSCFGRYYRAFLPHSKLEGQLNLGTKQGSH